MYKILVFSIAPMMRHRKTPGKTHSGATCFQAFLPRVLMDKEKSDWRVKK